MSLPEGGNQAGNNDNQNEIANESNALNNVAGDDRNQIQNISLDSLLQKDGNKAPGPEKKAHKDLRIAPRADKENVKEKEFKPRTI